MHTADQIPLKQFLCFIEDNVIILGDQECLQTSVNVEKICQERDKNKCPCDLETSCDAGRSVVRPC